VFRFADGLTHALFPLSVMTVYGLPIWAVAATSAVMNLAGVPAAFFWTRAMERGPGRRRAAVAGFGVAAVALLALAFQPPFPVFLLVAVLFTVFGIATAPAAGALVLEGLPRRRWAGATASLSRLTGYAYLVGTSIAVVLGLAGWLDLPVVFAAAAGTSLMAALLAHRTIRPYHELYPGEKTQRSAVDQGVVVAGQRRFERAVFFPGRLFHRPTGSGIRQALQGRMGPFLVAILLLFFGTTMFLVGYPAILKDSLQLSDGLVLLAMAPATFMTPVVYRTAGFYGEKRGMGHGITVGGSLRALAVPAMCAVAMLVGADLAWVGFVLFVLLPALLGVSFAFMQVNGPCIAATLHPDGHGEGVGTWHAAVSIGIVTGSVLATLLLWFVPVWITYLFATAATLAGAILIVGAVARVRAELAA
jgi:MFS family permease